MSAQARSEPKRESSAADEATRGPAPARPSTEAVKAEYAGRLESRRMDAARFGRLDRALSNWRLAVFAAGAAVVWMAFVPEIFSPGWIAAPVLVFLALAVYHDLVIRQGDRAARAVGFYDRGIARLENRWPGTGVPGSRYSEASHPYADDLDLFGRGSLFELLCTARTRAGEDRLADWLRAPAPPETVRARQAAVDELRPRLDLREELALLGEALQSGIDPGALSAWGGQPRILVVTPGARMLGFALAGAAIVGGAIWATGVSSIPFWIAILAGRWFERVYSQGVARVVKGVDRPAKDLALLADLLRRIEAEPFETPLLRGLREGLTRDGAAASDRIRQLERMVDQLHALSNMVFAVVGSLLLWRTQWAISIEEWRGKCGADLAEWLCAVGEFEALNALASYAYERPEDAFPQILDEGAIFEAEGLTHPLLPAATAVRNDIRIGRETGLFVVSGSNMSGKSTLLRSIGTNAVLALAGAPVRARRLEIGPVHLGASIRTLDSLQGGTSRFYAEILRLRQIVDIAREHPPLLFLLDEILHGTNSHDRRVGAEAVARALIGRGATGLITTHDLALARIAEDPSLRAANVHFEDQLVEGQMRFDYHLRPGVVEKSNAIELMRAVGLEV